MDHLLNLAVEGDYYAVIDSEGVYCSEGESLKSLLFVID